MRPRLPARGLVLLTALISLLLIAASPLSVPRPERDGGGPRIMDRLVHQGIAVDLEVVALEAPAARTVLQEGDVARFRFKITDTTSGQPLSGVYPAAWMDHLVLGLESDARSCTEKVQEFVAGSIFSQAELDLNVFYVLALNEDATITVVDPLFGFGGTHLLAMINLNAPGEDWVLTQEEDRLFVSMPGARAVAVIDTARWQVTENLPLPGPARQVRLQPDGAYLWVGYGDSESATSGVAVFNATTLEAVATIATGRGRHTIAFRPDSRLAFVTNGLDGTLSVVDVRTLSVTEQLRTGDGPVAVDYSPLAGAVYVAHAGDGTVVAVDGQQPRILARANTAPGVVEMRFSPDGRYALLPHPPSDRVFVLDAVSNRVIHAADVEDGPFRVGFSRDLAYVQHLGTATILMIPMATLAQEGGPVSVIDFPAGQTPFGDGSGPGPAPSLIQAPGGDAVLVANPGDEAIYYYREGMAAPMGSFRNYGRRPRAVEVVDRSLQEKSPGSYETVAALRRPGRYSLAFFLDSPRIVHCFPLEVVANPEAEALRRAAAGAQVLYLNPDPRQGAADLAAGQELAVRFRLLDSVGGLPLTDRQDVQVMAFKPPGTRPLRARAEALGDGVYQAALTPDRPGRYTVIVSCPSCNLPFDRSPTLTVVVDTP